MTAYSFKMAGAAFAAALILAQLTGCGKNEKKPGGQPASLVTATSAQSRTMLLQEVSVGEVDSQTAPVVSAEVTGRVLKVGVEPGASVKAGQLLAQLEASDHMATLAAAEAEVKRSEAILSAQQRATERDRELIKRKFISPAKLEETEAQLKVQEEGLKAAIANRNKAAQGLARTRIVSPITGRVDTRLVSVGDLVTVGKPLFQLTSTGDLRVRLPYPETVANRIKPGMSVRLSSASAPEQLVMGKVTEIRPTVGSSSRSFDAIVQVANPGGWKPGGSVNGAVVVEEHENAVVVPETSVVLRPAGKVVYLAKDGKAVQRIVKTGTKEAGWIELTEGLAAGETIVVDGAGFLSDGAAITVKGSEKQADSAKK